MEYGGIKGELVCNGQRRKFHFMFPGRPENKQQLDKFLEDAFRHLRMAALKGIFK